MRTTALPVLLLVMAVLLVPAASAEEGLSVGARAPDFSLPSTTGDRTVTLSEFAGKSAVILHFWKSR